MKLQQITLYIGIIHEKSEEEETIDIFKITTNISEMLESMSDLENKVKAKQFAATEAEQNIDNNLTIINQWIAEIPVLQDQADEIQSSIDILQNELNALEQQLLHKARKNVKKRNRIKKAIGVCRAVANCLPMLGP